MTDPDITKEEIIRGCGQDDIEHVCVKKLYYQDGTVVFNKRYVPDKIISSDYWASRERDLLMALHLKKIPNVVKTAVWRDGRDGNLLELETIDAGPTIADWFATPASQGTGWPWEYCIFTRVDEFLKLLRGCLLTLKTIHTKNIVHCDIKADNISLPADSLADGRLQLRYDKTTLIDFGFSIIHDSELLLQRTVPINYKKADYLSDFQRWALKQDHRKKRPKEYQRLDYSCDLYSLGVMARKISSTLANEANGFHVYDVRIRAEDLEDIVARLLKFRNGIPRRLRNKQPGFAHDQIIEAIEKCLQTMQATSWDVSVRFIPGTAREQKPGTGISPPVYPPTYVRDPGKMAPQEEEVEEREEDPGESDDRAEKRTKLQAFWQLVIKKPDKIVAWYTIASILLGFVIGIGMFAYKNIGQEILPMKRIFQTILETVSQPPPEKSRLTALYEKISHSDFWRTGKGPKPQNWDTFIKLLESEATQGNHEALAILSGLHQMGRGVKQDSRQAFQGYRTVMEGGKVGQKLLKQVHAAAGTMAQRAVQGGDTETITAILPDIKAMATQGSPYWQAVMGEVYRLGATGKPDIQTATTWFEKAAAQYSDPQVKKWAEQSLSSLD